MCSEASEAILTQESTDSTVYWSLRCKHGMILIRVPTTLTLDRSTVMSQAERAARMRELRDV